MDGDPEGDASRLQARLLIVELERAADAIVEQLESGNPRASDAGVRRAELYEARAHIRRLQERYGLSAIATRPDAGARRPDRP
ncbi:hypothetical protein [Gordonia insulae]|uniref:Uncharacterized protein n=1 Tax=Gordonia insulae TaxID=2420509 RepID=A0A3G8JFX2_9ACTN|nr:hypothetical protein [Gordonia insulae]AZG43913.1 hypothetical protein D7316_00488 [Gordonia insulae]